MRAWFRVDNRLVHGQVIEAWLPYLDAAELVVVNDALARDDLRQRITKLAVPGRVEVFFAPLNEAKRQYDRLADSGNSALFLFASCWDAVELVKEGAVLPILNVGNIHYVEGRKQICRHVAVSEKDINCLDWLQQRGTKLDFRCVPGDVPIVEEWKCS